VSAALDTLIAQRDDLQRQIDALEAERRASLIAQAHAALKALGVTAADLLPARVGRKAPRSRAPAPVRYRDDKGNTWTGRGQQPVWLRARLASGATLGDFLLTAGA
jgi:DNA-binding protein H-NS